jgi:hypothetical protein
VSSSLSGIVASCFESKNGFDLKCGRGAKVGVGGGSVLGILSGSHSPHRVIIRNMTILAVRTVRYHQKVLLLVVHACLAI